MAKWKEREKIDIFLLYTRNYWSCSLDYTISKNFTTSSILWYVYIPSIVDSIAIVLERLKLRLEIKLLCFHIHGEMRGYSPSFCVQEFCLDFLLRSKK